MGACPPLNQSKRQVVLMIERLAFQSGFLGQRPKQTMNPFTARRVAKDLSLGG